MKQKKNHHEKNIRLNLVSHISVFGLLLGALPVAEANWRVSPEVGVGVEYDDNSQLSNIPGASSSDTSFGVSALATFFYNTRLTNFTISPRLRSRWHQNNGALDSNDQFLKFDLNHERQKSNFRFRGDYSSESVRTAERSDIDFDIEDPEEVPVDNSGLVFDTGKRDRLRLLPELSFKLSQRTALSVRGEYLDTSYDNDGAAGLTGFTEYGGGVSFGYSVTQKDIVSLDVYTGTFETDASDSDSSSSYFGIGYNRRVSERTQFRLLVGSSASEDGLGEDQTNPVAEISVIHKYATMRIIASYRRAVSGSGAGGLSVRDTFSLNVSRTLSPKLTLSGGIQAFQTDALDSADVNFTERDYLQFRALARWNLTRAISLDLDYRFTDNKRALPGLPSVSNDSSQIGLWVYWRPNPLLK